MEREIRCKQMQGIFAVLIHFNDSSAEFKLH